MNRFIFFFVLLSTVSYIILVNFAVAQPPTPLVPEFTASFSGQPYYVTNVTNIDPYTGNITVVPDYYSNNGSINILIKNQPFNSLNGTYSLYYNIRMKGHFEVDNWSSPYRYLDCYPLYNESTYYHNPSPRDNGLFWSGADSVGLGIPTNDPIYPPNAQIDIQVQALVYTTTIPSYEPQYWTNQLTLYASSAWSETKTVTIPPANSSLPSDVPTASAIPSPSVPEFPHLPFLAITLAGLTTIVITLTKKRP